jgi:enoyl-CoA hydratase
MAAPDAPHGAAPARDTRQDAGAVTPALAGADAAPDIRSAVATPGVLLLTLDRPKVRNALRTVTLAQVAQALARADADDEIGAVVLTGGVQWFAAGADVREMAALGPLDLLLHERQRHWRAIAEFAKPLIGVVCGHALGGGCELALCCDLLVAGDNAQFGQPEVNLGIMPGAGGAARLARSVGKSLAMQLVLTGQPIDARTAHAAGLVVEVLEPQAAMARGLELAAHVATRPRLAVRLAQQAVLRAFELPLSDALAAERQAFALLAASDDRREGIAAFLEKRTPQFRGR